MSGKARTAIFSRRPRRGKTSSTAATLKAVFIWAMPTLVAAPVRKGKGPQIPSAIRKRMRNIPPPIRLKKR